MADDPPDHLVARHDGQPPGWQVPLDDLQVGAAHRAGTDIHEHLAGTGHEIGALAADQPPGPDRAGMRKLHRDHLRPPGPVIMVTMDWIRENVKTIGAVLVFAMALPFLLVLLGVITF